MILSDQLEEIGKFPGTYHICHTCCAHIQEMPDSHKTPGRQEAGQAIGARGHSPSDRTNELGIITSLLMEADGDLRTYLNLIHLNQTFRSDHYRTPTLEEITHELAGSTKFTKVDRSSSYYYIVLDYESSLLTTFNTHRRRFCFVHLPFRLTCAQDIFQRMIESRSNPGQLWRSHCNHRLYHHIW